LSLSQIENAFQCEAIHVAAAAVQLLLHLLQQQYSSMVVLYCVPAGCALRSSGQ
jgi:hypothetical protein